MEEIFYIQREIFQGCVCRMFGGKVCKEEIKIITTVVHVNMCRKILKLGPKGVNIGGSY